MHKSELFFDFIRKPFVIRVQKSNLFSCTFSNSQVSCRGDPSVILVKILYPASEMSNFLSSLVCRTVVYNQNFYIGVRLVEGAVYSISNRIRPIVCRNNDADEIHNSFKVGISMTLFTDIGMWRSYTLNINLNYKV